MLLAISLLFAHGRGPDLDQPVTLDLKAVTGKQLTEAISARTGIRFEAMDEAVKDRYVVHFDKAPLRQVMTKIADAELGEWFPYDSGFRLRRSPGRVTQALAARRTDQISRFQKCLDGYKKELGLIPDFSDDAAKDLARKWKALGQPPANGSSGNSDYWGRENRLQQSLPIGRAFMRVLLTFSPADFADIPTRFKVVFSTNPTGMQHLLPESAFNALRAMIDEQLIWEEAVQKYLPENIDQSWNGMDSGGKIRNITNAMIVMSRWDANAGVQAQLILSDKKRRIVTETYLYVEGQRDAPENQPRSGTKPPPRLPVSPLDTELASIFSWEQPRPGTEAHPLSPAAQAILSDPEKSDPLGTFVADSLISLATSRKENLAAVVDDRSIPMVANSINSKGLDPQVLNMIPAWNIQDLKEKDGWMVLSEIMPPESDIVNADRTALHQLLRSATEKGRVTIDDAAGYALTSERFQENPIPDAYVQAVLADRSPSTLQDDANLLRFYGSLDANQRQHAASLPIRSLSAEQIQMLNLLVYGMNANLQEEAPEAPQEAPQPDEDGQYYGFWNMIDREPSVSLGNGIPSDGTIEITSNSDKAIVATMQYGEWYQGEQTYDIQSLAYMIASQGQQDESPWTVLGMRPADRTQVMFHFKYTPKIGQNLSLDDVQAKSKRATGITGLPDETRLALLKAIDEAKKQYAQGGGIFYGGQVRSSGVPR